MGQILFQVVYELQFWAPENGGGAQMESPFGWERGGHVQDRQVLQGDLVGRITGEKVTGWSCAHLRPIKDRISTTGLPKF